jgi:ABC-2 type transport system permease protein
MKQILHIAFRELNTFFDSLTAYVLIIIFLGFSGFFTWIYGADVFFVGQASLSTFFTVAYWSLFIFIPALTMRSIAGELKAGTLELLLTKPVSDWQLILGKFLSTFFLISIALAPTLLYYISLWLIGPIDHSAVILGYVGLLLMSMVYISIGLLTSCLFSNPIVASLTAISIGIFFHIIFDVLASNFVGFLGSLFSFLSLSTHFESITRGVVDTKDIIYFCSIAFFCLYSSKMILSNRNLHV